MRTAEHWVLASSCGSGFRRGEAREPHAQGGPSPRRQPTRHHRAQQHYDSSLAVVVRSLAALGSFAAASPLDSAARIRLVPVVHADRRRVLAPARQQRVDGSARSPRWRICALDGQRGGGGGGGGGGDKWNGMEWTEWNEWNRLTGTGPLCVQWINLEGMEEGMEYLNGRNGMDGSGRNGISGGNGGIDTKWMEGRMDWNGMEWKWTILSPEWTNDCAFSDSRGLTTKPSSCGGRLRTSLQSAAGRGTKARDIRGHARQSGCERREVGNSRPHAFAFEQIIVEGRLQSGRPDRVQVHGSEEVAGSRAGT